MENIGVFDSKINWQHRNWFSHRLADFVFIFHLGITLFCGFAWLGDQDWMLMGVVLLYGSTELLWKFRSSSCILTDIERGLRGVSKPNSVLEQNFIRRLILSVFKMDIDPLKIIIYTRAWGRIGFSIAMVRLIFRIVA